MLSERGNAQIKRAGRIVLVISLIAMIGLFVFQILRGEVIPIETVIASVIWAGWVGYMLFRSNLLSVKK